MFYLGIHEVTRKIFADGDLGRVESLDLSDCQLDDECLIRLVPIFGHVSELNLSDNNFTWYVVIVAIHKGCQPFFVGMESENCRQLTGGLKS